MAEKKVQHIHKYKRLTYKSGNQVFFCALPDCNQKINPALALGKRSICWRCGESFIMSEYSLRLAKPHCESCHKSKKEIAWIHEPTQAEREAANEIAKEIIKEISLSERLAQTIQQAQTKKEEGDDEL